MNDLKNYPGKILERANPRGWWYWVKHHLFTVLIFAGCVAFVVGVLTGKSSVIIFDSTDTHRTYTPGAKVLYTATFPDPIYDYSQPMPVQIYCVDGEKFVVFAQISAHKLEGYCE